MVYTPASISSPMTSIAVLITDDDALRLGLDPITQAIAQAQEQLHHAMETQWAEDLQQWMEKGWEEQRMSEKDRMRVLDKKVAVVVAKAVMVEIERKSQKVSIRFPQIYIQNLTCLLGVEL